MKCQLNSAAVRGHSFEELRLQIMALDKPEGSTARACPSKGPQKRATGGPCRRCERVACCQWYSSPEHGPRSLCWRCHEETVGGPCCRCGLEKCYSWYTGPKGPKTLCRNCYDQTRRPGMKLLGWDDIRAVKKVDSAGTSESKRKRGAAVGSDELEEGEEERHPPVKLLTWGRKRAPNRGRSKAGINGNGTPRVPCNSSSANEGGFEQEGLDPFQELDVMDVIGLFEAQETSARGRKGDRRKAAERKGEAEADVIEAATSGDADCGRLFGANGRGRAGGVEDWSEGREGGVRDGAAEATGERNAAANERAACDGARPRADDAVSGAGGLETGAQSLGEQGVGFGDCLLFDEFLAERWQDEHSETETEMETETETAQLEGAPENPDVLAEAWDVANGLWEQNEPKGKRVGSKEEQSGHVHTEVCLSFDREYGRFCGVTGAFLGRATEEDFVNGPGRASHDDRLEWQDRCMGRVLERLWAQKEPPFGGWGEDAKRGKKKRITLDDIPESARSHAAAVRAAERRAPEELVAEHGGAAAAAFWAVLESSKKAMKSQVEGFEFAMKNLTGSADGLGGQAGDSDGASETGSAEPGRGSSDAAAFEGPGKGCILAHAPGCGKTLLGWAVFWWLQRLNPGLLCLTLAPASVLEVWEHQRPVSRKTYHVGQSQGLRTDDVTELETGTNLARCRKDLRVWAEKRDGMLLLSNERMRALLKAAAAAAPDTSAEMSRLLLEAPGVVFFDEAHNLRNNKTRLHKYIRSLRTHRRLLLTGTPFNNSYDELWTLLYFAQPETMLRWGAGEHYSAGRAPTELEARREFLEKYNCLINGPLETPRAGRRKRELK